MCFFGCGLFYSVVFCCLFVIFFLCFFLLLLLLLLVFFWFYFVIVFYCYPKVCIAEPSTLKYNDYDGKTQMGSFFQLNCFFYQGYDKSIFISFIELNLNKMSIHLMSYMYEYNVQFVFIWFLFRVCNFFTTLYTMYPR